jgi:hypothetical protein
MRAAGPNNRLYGRNVIKLGNMAGACNGLPVAFMLHGLQPVSSSVVGPSARIRVRPNLLKEQLGYHDFRQSLIWGWLLVAFFWNFPAFPVSVILQADCGNV